MITEGLRVSDTTEAEFLELIFFQIDEKISEKYWRADLCSFSDPLTC